jgi:hypothetical protein
VLLVSALAQAQCTKDTDCKGDRVCEAGKCTSPPNASPPAPAGSEVRETPQPGSDSPPAADGAGPAKPSEGTSALAPAPSSASDVRVQPPAEDPDARAPALESDEPKTRRRSRSAMVAGIAMVSVGPIALLAALAAKNAQNRCDDALQRDYPDHRLPPSERFRVDDCNAYSTPLYVFGIGGALLSVAGIPLIVYGAKSVRDDAPRATLQVLPWAGPESSGLRLRLDM